MSRHGTGTPAGDRAREASPYLGRHRPIWTSQRGYTGPAVIPDDQAARNAVFGPYLGRSQAPQPEDDERCPSCGHWPGCGCGPGCCMCLAEALVSQRSKLICDRRAHTGLHHDASDGVWWQTDFEHGASDA